jgi:DegV family protein with EDD domain
MIHIIADTTSCIPVEEANQKGLGYIPQIIVFGDETYRDDTEMTPQLFLQRLRASSTLPKTAAPPPALYTPIFKSIAEQGDTAIVICPSTELSGTYRSATVAAQEFPDADIRIIDTRLIAGGLGSVVNQALKWVDEGLDADTIVANIQDMSKRDSIYFVVGTLEYLYKGGRIGAASALFGSLLQVKPILYINNGVIGPCENSRTRKRSISRLREIVLSQCPPGPESHVCVMHGDAEEEALQLISDLSKALNIPENEIPLYNLPPAILVHAGPGVLGASFFTADKDHAS